MKKEAIAALVEPVVARCALEVDRIEIAAAGKRSVLRIYVDGDGPDGRGPSLDQIAQATRALSSALDDSTVTGHAPYTLEVSSRGVSRPLAAPTHFRRNTGRLVTLTLAESATTGRIVETDASGVILDVDGAARRFEFDTITKAVVQAELRKDAIADDADEQE